jgi:flavin reductase (DIM6/NTAB) family NADH-FMN oxidoreductase RutF
MGISIFKGCLGPDTACKNEKGGVLMKKKKQDVSRISLPCPVILLSAGTAEKQDAMTATAMFVSEEPPLVVVSVGKYSFSHGLIEKTGEFVLNVAATEQVKLAKLLGATHGGELDKFKEFNIGIEEAESVVSPLIKGSFSHLECKVITSYPLGHYVLYLASVSAYKVDEKKVPLAWHALRYFSLDKGVT